MITVVLPTANRPAMLRTALRSIEEQTAKEEIKCVLVSENGGNRESGNVCAEFPALPIRYVFREPALPPFDHGATIYDEARQLPSRYVAVLHDDDWWGTDHIANALTELRRYPDAKAYWSTSFLVQGESSWMFQCWNESVWIAADYPPLSETVVLSRKQAALACLGSGPAHYSSLVAEKETLFEGFSAVKKTGNLFDNDRLLFLDLATRGPLLVNLVPEVFVRQHPAQDQASYTLQGSGEHIAAATRLVLDFCRNEGIDVLREYRRLYDECPIPAYRQFIMGVFDPRAVAELRRQNALPLQDIPKPRPGLKQIAQGLCPPVGWNAGRRMAEALRRKRNGRVVPRAAAHENGTAKAVSRG